MIRLVVEPFDKRRTGHPIGGQCAADTMFLQSVPVFKRYDFHRVASELAGHFAQAVHGPHIATRLVAPANDRLPNILFQCQHLISVLLISGAETRGNRCRGSAQRFGLSERTGSRKKALFISAASLLAWVFGRSSLGLVVCLLVDHPIENRRRGCNSSAIFARKASLAHPDGFAESEQADFLL